MPPLANFSLLVLKDELKKIGIHLLEEFPDGQTRWGSEPPSDPYTGSSCMASEYRPGKYDIYTVRAIVERLDMAGHLPRLEERLYERINE